MVSINWYKVTTLPTFPEPNSVYYVVNGDYVDTYVTDSSGNAKASGTEAMILELTSLIDGGTF